MLGSGVYKDEDICPRILSVHSLHQQQQKHPAPSRYLRQTKQQQHTSIFTMKFTAVAFAALATLATASPHPPPPPHGCKPATYSCLPHDNGWQVCSTAGQWVVSIPYLTTHEIVSRLSEHKLLE